MCMKHHMHSAPQSKKEENREERKKNHRLLKSTAHVHVLYPLKDVSEVWEVSGGYDRQVHVSL